MKKILLAFVVSSSILSLSSCSKKGANYVYFDNPPEPRFSKRVYPIKNIFNDAQVDILWVVDNSGSMNGIQNNVIKNSKIFMDNFTNGSTLDWKVGLMSTDRSDPPYIGVYTSLDRSTPNPVPLFQDAVSRLGTNGDASEYVFYNVNRGVLDLPFLRKNSHLAVIMVTDEKEQSLDKFGAPYEAQIFLERIKAVVGVEHNLRFYGALDMDDLTSCKNYNVYYKGSPFEEVINETGGFVISACVSDFGTQLADIGKDILTLVESPKILLDERPIIETIKVLYQGEELPGGLQGIGNWYYDRYFNTINFYNLNFSETDIDNDDIQIEFQIDDGIDRNVE